ncbi:hypothetical protein EK599_06335 [Vibrio sp. T187]|uniref:hypothetical protein n=1 Tax=Vibrio TaxID=662 RepID=UPI0010C9CFF7|nr:MULTISPECIES: hypothetical protein [Vibrio]MBW3695303.1 hypothetical protein [Vibrio sp. T187]
MKTKNAVMAFLSPLLLSACQIVSIDDLQPTATQETIDIAIEHLSDIKGMTVTEKGVIYYVQTLPGESRWNTGQVMKSSYRVSCDNLRWFVENGMIVRMNFRGNSGTTQDYDLERCDSEAPTDSDK